ncbi:MAG TPA: M20/M25/M40 family metallo-hydrolase [Baekduia sp.]|uniref:M20/M25/M40 family metallo-hydrolase n=1 Tax=Baekduia sp. TaxID=2600305 RepID=UPI002D7784CC|nr:M20/M25/M40 family metallo-hydrolase [Baekduia sp.]HET6508692.1 M20/M25/M40 family metallo-hydrolase [Baekduia sp.]
MALEDRAVGLLQQLIRHRTVNPPGDERALQEELAAAFTTAGFEVSLLGRTPERPNLVARLRGVQDGPVLGLLSHVDTVLADPSEWQRDPWSGDLVDGEVWGRGAQDMKSQTAAECAAALDLAASGWRPERGDLLVIVVVDEETGGADGAIWLTENHPALVRCDYLLNEGAGTVIPHGSERLYGVCIAEKGVFRLALTTHGAAGHASMPNVADNALPKLAPLLEALATRRPSPDLTEAPRTLLSALGFEDVEALRAANPALAAFFEPMASVTFAPTIISAGEKINVIPSRAELKVDCRVPPGHGRETAEQRLLEVLGDAGRGQAYDVAWLEEVVGNGSPAASPLMDAIARFVEAEDPGARVVPMMLPAYTDSRAFRDAFPECVAYGFFPQREMTLGEMWPLVHGKDERIAAADVGFAARAYRSIALELLGSGDV